MEYQLTCMPATLPCEVFIIVVLKHVISELATMYAVIVGVHCCSQCIVVLRKGLAVMEVQLLYMPAIGMYWQYQLLYMPGTLLFGV